MTLAQQRANAIRALSMDATQKANSGHPGMPMGMADIAEVLWHRFLKHSPSNPNWPNCDRFVLSNGHGAMLQYALLHLTGYDLSIEDIKQFRQHHSKTPGHPEYHDTPGVQTSTGPLGQGLGNAVGMALAEAKLAQDFNRDDFQIVDHFTYVFLGDGCLMEGISHEVCSLAGTLKLGKLIAFWDDNGISIDGDVSGWFTDNTSQRFNAYGWHVIEDVDGHHSDAIALAIQEAQAVTDKPSLICCKTKIGYGAPNAQGTAKCHGAPLGDEEIAATRKNIDWPHPPFSIPKEIAESWDATQKGLALEQTWKDLFKRYQERYPDLAKEWLRRQKRQLPDNMLKACQDTLKLCLEQKASLATRKASQQWLNSVASTLPELLGGSADLTGSNLTHHQNSVPIQAGHYHGNYLHYGVREFGMAAIMNGLALYGMFIPYGGTFLVFQDYARNAIRLSALMQQKVIYVLTHDSIGLGEDGPTHQPVEQMASLRAMPNLLTWRPCDTVETAIAWESALHYQGPTCLFLSRQTLPYQKRQHQQVEQTKRGACILLEPEAPAKLILIATGSEVQCAMAAAQRVNQDGLAVRVVSMPSPDLFDQQSQAFQEEILPTHIEARIAIEAGSSMSWYKYIGPKGKVIGLDEFGLSAPGNTVFEHFGFTPENVIQTILTLTKEGVTE